MSWPAKYWDALDQLYWSPQYLALGSIPPEHKRDDGDRISVPKEMTNAGGGLYRRTMKHRDFAEYAQKQEELFNHIFDITFAIAPSQVLTSIFGLPSINEKMETLGRDIRHRYSKKGNLTSPDGFFVSANSLLAIELKFNAKTSRNQFAKYIYLICNEEQFSGPKTSLSLTFVFNSEPTKSLTKQLAWPTEDLSKISAQELTNWVKATEIREYLKENNRLVGSVLSKLKVQAIDWATLKANTDTYASTLGPSISDQTLQNLLNGFSSEIENHPLSNVSSQAQQSK